MSFGHVFRRELCDATPVVDRQGGESEVVNEHRPCRITVQR